MLKCLHTLSYINYEMLYIKRYEMHENNTLLQDIYFVVSPFIQARFNSNTL